MFCLWLVFVNVMMKVPLEKSRVGVLFYIIRVKGQKNRRAKNRGSISPSLILEKVWSKFLNFCGTINESFKHSFIRVADLIWKKRQRHGIAWCQSIDTILYDTHRWEQSGSKGYESKSQWKEYSFCLQGHPRWHPTVICFKPRLFHIILNGLAEEHEIIQFLFQMASGEEGSQMLSMTSIENSLWSPEDEENLKPR